MFICTDCKATGAGFHPVTRFLGTNNTKYVTYYICNKCYKEKTAHAKALHGADAGICGNCGAVYARPFNYEGELVCGDCYTENQNDERVSSSEMFDCGDCGIVESIDSLHGFTDPKGTSKLWLCSQCISARQRTLVKKSEASTFTATHGPEKVNGMKVVTHKGYSSVTCTECKTEYKYPDGEGSVISGWVSGAGYCICSKCVDKSSSTDAMEEMLRKINALEKRVKELEKTSVRLPPDMAGNFIGFREPCLDDDKETTND